MSNWGRSGLVLVAEALIAAIVELLSFLKRDWFVPLTYVMVDVSNMLALIPFLLGGLAGHFWGPRPRRFDNGMMVIVTGHWRVGVALASCSLASAVMFSASLAASAFLGGYVAGSIYFLSGDRRKA